VVSRPPFFVCPPALEQRNKRQQEQHQEANCTSHELFFKKTNQHASTHTRQSKGGPRHTHTF
jgi:hypothetical protein